jgi:ribosomal protein S18 acetylase RimI-like enzyme
VAELTWQTAGDDVLGEVAALARACLTVDGGMPLAADEEFLRRRYAGPQTTTTTVRASDGQLIAVSAVRPASAGGDGGAAATGLVDPRWRGRGIGAQLLDRALETAQAMADGLTPAGSPRRAGRVSVETESLTPAVAQLFASRGLRQVFAEDIMRFDFTTSAAAAARDGGGAEAREVRAAAVAVPSPVWPAGTRLADWTDETAPRFFAVYAASFRDRPGFPGWSAEQWISWTVDDGFRPDWSVLATVPEVGDAGFVTCAEGWIIQVGVVPAARGRGLGAALVGEALRRMGADGAREALLDVNVDNPAGELYRRLGFTVLGRRARFERPTQ